MPSQIEAYFRELRAREFRRLDEQNHAYLDYTGAALYPESLVREHAEQLVAEILGNPHSDSPSSRASTAHVEAARAAVLHFFDADPDEYAVCFTANASGALKLVAEAYPFGPRSRLVLSADNHNSVNGIRAFAGRAGAEVRYVPLDAELRLTDVDPVLDGVDADPSAASLLAFPAQSNFSGVRHPLSLVHTARQMGYDVLLDAAAYVPTSRLSLRDVPATFVALSFYKIFGYPGGVGALVARRDALARLRRPWFAGGTVDFVSTRHPLHRLKHGAEAFEDGTVNFLGIAAVPAGLRFMERVGMERLGYHVTALGSQLLGELQTLRHADGSPLVRVYGPPDDDGRGATVALNVLDRHGRVVDYERVEERTRRAGISVRGGCFCNPGAAEHAFRFPAARTEECLRSLLDGEFSANRFRRCLGGPAVGAIRVSAGMASTAADLQRFLDVLETFRGMAAAGSRTRSAEPRSAVPT